MRVISNATDNQTSDAENRAEQVCCTSETDMLHFGTYYIDISTNVGGGVYVAIVFDPGKIAEKEYKTEKNSHETIAAVGKLPNVKRRI